MKQEFKRIKTFAEVDNSPVHKSSNSDIYLIDPDRICNINIKKRPKKNKRLSKIRNRSLRHKTMCYGKNSVDFSNLLSNLLLQKTQVQNVNININYTNIHKNSVSQERNPRKKSPTELWTKTRNIQKMVRAFLHPQVEKINDKEIFKETLRSTLLGISKERLNQKLGTSNSSTNDNTHNNLTPIDFINKDIEIPFGEFMRKTEVEKEFIRVNLKERAFRLITEMYCDPGELVVNLEKLFRQNPEKNRYVSYDENYLFNQPLSNGKTLLYIACQDDNYIAVKYLLSKKLNPNIRSLYYNMEDTCLWVSCRWGYYGITKALLSTGIIYVHDIEEQLKRGDCTKLIRNLLKKYLSNINKNKKHKDKCKCF